VNPIIALWAHPRSLSTAFERMMIERGDTIVLHEPFSRHYHVVQQHTVGPHAHAEVRFPSDYPEITRTIRDMARVKPLFFKEIAYHGYEHLVLDKAFLGRLYHTFIIRDPARTIASHFAVNPALALGEIGYWHQYMLFQRIASLTGTAPTVVDADDLITDPVGIVRAYCHAAGIPFMAEALHWQPGERREWSVWRDWHVHAAASHTFTASDSDYAQTIENNGVLKSYYDYHMPFYLELRRHRLQPHAA
jgi:hypothetical protein